MKGGELKFHWRASLGIPAQAMNLNQWIKRLVSAKSLKTRSSTLERRVKLERTVRQILVGKSGSSSNLDALAVRWRYI